MHNQRPATRVQGRSYGGPFGSFLLLMHDIHHVAAVICTRPLSERRPFAAAAAYDGATAFSAPTVSIKKYITVDTGTHEEKRSPFKLRQWPLSAQ